MEQQNDQLPQAIPPKPVNNKIIWFAFFISIFVYNIVAILITQMPDESRIKTFAPKLVGTEIEARISTQDEFAGFIGLDSGTYSLLFSVFLIIAAVNFIVIFKLKAKAESKTPVLGPSESPINFGLLRIAFAESMAIFGLVLFLLNGDLSHLMFFTGLAIASMVLVYPRR